MIGDLISPFKAAIGLDYKAFENRLLEAIHVRFGLPGGRCPTRSPPPSSRPTGSPPTSRRRVLAGFTQDEADRYFGIPAIPPQLAKMLARLDPLPVAAAQKRFLARFRALAKG